MKIKIDPIDTFTPRTLSITFESKEEVTLFTTMLSYNETIPGVIFKLDSFKATKLATLMTQIHNEAYRLGLGK